jgi:outer membrane protein assembly factor BamE (lipoprotein component of BamABCDE complex)
MKIVKVVIVCTLIWSDTASCSGLEDPFINIGEAEKQELAEKVKLLKQGDSVKRVLELLGKPFSDDLM